jgi:hypothetical protein
MSKKTDFILGILTCALLIVVRWPPDIHVWRVIGIFMAWRFYVDIIRPARAASQRVCRSSPDRVLR